MTRYENDIKILKSLFEERDAKSFFIKTYGCQQNVYDSGKIAGILSQAGLTAAADPADADIIVFNTCAVREHAEEKVLGHLGQMKKYKETNRNLLIAMGGCMVEQQHIKDRLRANYPFVDIVFDTNSLEKLPSLIIERINSGKKAFVSEQIQRPCINEEMPVVRDDKVRTFIPIMYGCDNFCSYCIVPYVRGRERSRASADIEKEFRKAVSDGYRDITLLGQNVNSYGKGLDENINFAKLLRSLASIEGDFTVRFMTSHPKDATTELFEVIAENPKISRNIHLPVQAGSDEILKKMNRGYTVAEYEEKIRIARSIINDVSFTSDIIVGFPDETYEQFKMTTALIERVRFYSLFTFIYSKRNGTVAAKLPDSVTHEEKAKRLIELNNIQTRISDEYCREFVGKRQRVLITTMLENGKYEARLDNNTVVETDGSAVIGEFADIIVTELVKGRLYGKTIE